MTTFFIGNNPRLEALCEGTGSRCAVITHPHPLYGGDMHNNVVLAAHDAALNQGFMKAYLEGVLKSLVDQ